MYIQVGEHIDVSYCTCTWKLFFKLSKPDKLKVGNMASPETGTCTAACMCAGCACTFEETERERGRTPHRLSAFSHCAEEYNDPYSGGSSCLPASSKPCSVAAVHFLSPRSVSRPTFLTETDMVSIYSTVVCDMYDFKMC